MSSVSVLPRRGVSATRYDGTSENPTGAAVLDAVAAYKETGCDGVLAFSGGSSIVQVAAQLRALADALEAPVELH